MRLSPKQLEAIKGAIAQRELYAKFFDTHQVCIYANNTLLALGEQTVTLNQVRGVWASICRKRQQKSGDIFNPCDVAILGGDPSL